MILNIIIELKKITVLFNNIIKQMGIIFSFSKLKCEKCDMNESYYANKEQKERKNCTIHDFSNNSKSCKDCECNVDNTSIKCYHVWK